MLDATNYIFSEDRVFGKDLNLENKYMYLIAPYYSKNIYF